MPPKKGSAVSRLTDATPVCPTSASPKKKDVPVIVLEGDAAAVFDHYASADAVCKVAGAGQSEARGKLIEAATRAFLRLCITGGYAIANPQLMTERSRASFQVKHVSALPVEQDENDEIIPIGVRLLEAGFTEETAAEIVGKVVRCTSALRVKSLTEMASGSPAQQAVAERIGKYIEKWLTPEDRELMLERVEETTVDSSWKDVAVAVACKIGGEDLEKGVEALRRLFAVIPVQFAVSGAAYTGELKEAFGRLVPPPPAAG